MQQRMIHENQRHHGFGDWRGTDADAGIVTAVGLDHDQMTLLVDRLAWDANA